ncbi:MAG: hypothetical protein HETSPECPRED_002489 [Heterodermia speciosa]|uniref:Rhodopsin domain-containing protein n=1 Tax=Heterodermia speciosa TaxID=116794 RepID=A0A8H3IH25_9LECA|nr:MAG: hypothetical protein HETSPECPRED_002489 [Heterodermia speciosa]
MARIFLCRGGLPTNQVPPAQAFFATSIAFAFSVTALKLSVLFFYGRIFPQRQFRIICILVGIVCIAWFIAYIFLFFFTCIPFAYYWDKSIPGGHCMNENHIGYYGTTPPDILTNIVLLVLPIPYLWKLQMRKAKKIAITAIFVLGTFVLVGSIVRVPLLVQLKYTDVSYTVINAGIWLNVECNIGIISASLPTLRPFFSKIFSSVTLSKLSWSRTTRYGTGSQRLPDGEKKPRSSTLGNSNASAGVYVGQSKNHKSWFDNGVATMASKQESIGGGSSQEEMVPMGQIAVRHDLNWEAKERGIAQAV